MNEAFKDILQNYDLNTADCSIEPIGSGLVHQTFLIRGKKQFVLQKINTAIFKSPEQIAKNIKACKDYLNETHPEYLFVGFKPTRENLAYAIVNGNYWRLSPFVKNSITLDLLNNPSLAFEAAKAFGQLAKYLNHIPTENFEATIPDFHNLSYRFEQFQHALENGISEKINQSKELIYFYKSQKRIADVFEEIKNESLFPLRIQHHDTKINNVLLDKDSHNALAICDLDTLMPGYFISDLGDMVRTYTSAENEDSTNWDAIKVRPEYYNALMEGYLSEMEDSLTEKEKSSLFYAGEFMIYMQGLRFLSDYLLGDIYYPV
jgi:thiamine kinase-like enzyme